MTKDCFKVFDLENTVKTNQRCEYNFIVWFGLGP